jgi:hypothetical protein
MTTVRNLACLSIFLLAACGADPAPGPVEQIIVREPGAAPVETAAVVTDAAPAGALLAEGKAAFASCSACHALAFLRASATTALCRSTATEADESAPPVSSSPRHRPSRAA